MLGKFRDYSSEELHNKSKIPKLQLLTMNIPKAINIFSTELHCLNSKEKPKKTIKQQQMHKSFAGSKLYKELPYAVPRI